MGWPDNYNGSQSPTRMILVDPSTGEDTTPSSASGRVEPLGYENVSGLDLAGSLTVPEGATFAMIQSQDQPVRWRDDGLDPTPGSGMRLLSDQPPVRFDQVDLSAVKFIEESPTAILNVAYYRSA